MDKQNQLLRLFKLIQQIDINNKLEDGKFIFKQQTRKVIKNEIDRLSTIVQQPLCGSGADAPSPKLPSLLDVFYEQDRFEIDDIRYIHKIYKKLGNIV